MMEEHLGGVLGINKIPLSYLIRGNPEVPDLYVNPMRGETAPEGPYGTSYNSFYGEMIACAPHGTPKYDEDNATLMNILTELVSGTHHEASIKPYKRARDGRGAFSALSQHNLGNNRFEAIAEKAEGVLNRMPWTGKSARNTLKIHLAKHREAFNDLMQVSQNIAYVVPNPQMRARAFLISLRSTDMNIVSARNIMQSEPRYLNDFEEMAEYILRVCPEKGR